MAITKVSRGLLNTGVSDSSDATAITITSDEKVGIGVTTPENYTFGTPLAISAPSGANSGLTIVSATNSNGTIAMADGTSGSEAYKGYLQYSHSSDAMFIGAAGSVVTRFDSDGLKFGTDTAAANALDDYEEGSWTPAIAGSTNLSTYNAEYIKIGRKVYAYFYVSFNPVSNSSQFEITGLPYGQSGTHYGGGTVNYTGNANWSDAYGPLIAGSTIFFHKNSGTSASLTNADVYSKTSGSQQYLLASIHFYTA